MAEPLSLQHIARLICVQNLLDLTNGKDVTDYLKLAYHRYTNSLVVWRSTYIEHYLLGFTIQNYRWWTNNDKFIMLVHVVQDSLNLLIELWLLRLRVILRLTTYFDLCGLHSLAMYSASAPCSFVIDIILLRKTILCGSDLFKHWLVDRAPD